MLFRSNTHAAMLLQADQAIHSMVVDGQPATQLPEVRIVDEQRERQLANAAHEVTSGKIANGHKVSTSGMANSFHYQVALVYTSFPNVPDGQFCGGP